MKTSANLLLIFLLILSLIIVSKFIQFNIKIKSTEMFDHAGKYAWYRTPYSWYYWKNAMQRQRLWNLIHRRKYLSMNNYLYLP